MNSTPTPLIFSPIAKQVRVGLIGRVFALAISAGCLTLLGLAALLVPNPDGLGTHTALGLPQCAFLQTFGIPCPTCGMTTSWAWFVRGNLVASLWVQPMGTLLAVLACVGLWGGLYIALTGRAAHHLLAYLPGGYYTLGIAVLTLTLLAWLWKLATWHYHSAGWQ